MPTPTWITWCVLVVVSIWDIFAVFSPFGPLRILVEAAQKRSEQAVIESTGLDYTLVNMTDRQPDRTRQEELQSTESSGEQAQRQRRPTAEDLQEEEDGDINLGLGDIFFYSVLVGKASDEVDLNVTVACFVAVLIGLCSTIVIMEVCKRALPALPLPILFGLVSYFSTRNVISPFMDELSTRQIFV